MREYLDHIVWICRKVRRCFRDRVACARLPNRVLRATCSMRSPRREAGHAKRPAGWSCRTFTATTCMA